MFGTQFSSSIYEFLKTTIRGKSKTFLSSGGISEISYLRVVPNEILFYITQIGSNLSIRTIPFFFIKSSILFYSGKNISVASFEKGRSILCKHTLTL